MEFKNAKLQNGKLQSKFQLEITFKTTMQLSNAVRWAIKPITLVPINIRTDSLVNYIKPIKKTSEKKSPEQLNHNFYPKHTTTTLHTLKRRKKNNKNRNVIWKNDQWVETCCVINWDGRRGGGWGSAENFKGGSQENKQRDAFAKSHTKTAWNHIN